MLPMITRPLCPSDMKHLTKLLAALGLLLSLVCCTTEREYTADPYANYDRLWEILDRGYCYFDLKLPQGTTWRDLYHKHRRDLRPKMTTDSLFLVMSQLLAELRDGHVNLISTFDYGRYWQWRSEGPRSYDETLIESYLGNDYHIAGGLAYKALDYPKGVRRAEPIGYVRVASFSSAISSSNVNAVLNRLKACNGLILDLRNNGGGQVTTSDMLAQHFIRERKLVGYISHKTGPAHDAFSRRTPFYLDTLQVGTIWLKPVVVLVNQGVYSAANDFTLRMKGLPQVKIVGVKTGGGGGLPMSSELPNGWAVRFSSSRTYDADGADIEQGITPDVVLKDEIARGVEVDPYIEASASLLTRWILQIKSKQKKQ